MKGYVMYLAVGESFWFTWRGIKTDEGGHPMSECVLTGVAFELGDALIYEMKNTSSEKTYLKTLEELQQCVVQGEVEIEGVEL